MNEGLLWVAINGSTIGVIVFGALIVGGFLLWPGVKRVMIRLRARRLRWALGDPVAEGVSSHVGEVVTLVGRVKADGRGLEWPDGVDAIDGSAAVSLEMRPAEASTSARAERLWLDVCGDEVELEGLVEVDLGDRELYSHFGDAAAPVGAQGRAQLLAVRRIGDGQQVRVRGELSRVPTGPGDATYREPVPSHFALGPVRSGRAGTALRMASEAVPRVAGSPWAYTTIWFVLGVGGVSVMLSAMLLWMSGSVAMEVAESESSFTAATVAAATPGHRREALWWLTDALEERLVGDEGALEAYLALRRLQQRQSTAYAELMDARRYEQAAMIAAELGAGARVRRAAHELARRGQFDKASRWYARARTLESTPHMLWWRDEVLAHLMAGELEQAAEVTAREASQDGGHRQCIADAIAARAGDERALSRLVERGALEPEIAECRLLQADAVPYEARLAALDRCHECSSNPRWGRTATLLRYEALLALDGDAEARSSAARQAVDHFDTYSNVEGAPSLHLMLPGLERSVFDALDARVERGDLTAEERLLRERLAASVGTFDLLARADVVHERPSGAIGEPWPALWPDPLASMAELSAGIEQEGGDGGETAEARQDALEAYHDGLRRRETSVLIDIFAAW